VSGCPLQVHHQGGVAPSPLPPLTPSKPIGIKTPPPPTVSPPPHCLPGPIKCALAPGQLHHAHPHSPLFTSSPRAPRIPSTAVDLRSPPSLACLAAPPPEVSPPLGSPRCPLASRAPAASRRASERSLGRAPAAGHCEVHGGPVDRPPSRGLQTVDSVHHFFLFQNKSKSNKS
jgi:hypothetical protein